MGEPLVDCEEALVAHWSQLGRLAGARLHEEAGLLWFETPVRSLPFNGVVRSRIAPGAVAGAIERVLAAVRARGAQLWWAVHPTATPRDLGERLAHAGLAPVEQMNFMALELGADSRTSDPPPADVVIRRVDDAESQRAYTELTFAYWEVPEDERDAVAELHAQIGRQGIPGVRYLALLDGRAVGKTYLSTPGPCGVASLYGMSVLPEARGHGIARALTNELVAEAVRRGCRRFVLHATDMAVGVYARRGFARCGTAEIHATAPIWTDP